MEKKTILSMKNIHKEFPGVKALDGVDFDLKEGEILALMGENGAGKSTLVKVLTGVYRKNKGEIKLNGKDISPGSPLEAQEEGISTVYQEVNLCSNLTVAENIYIGRQPRKNGIIDWDRMNKNAQKALEKLNISIDVKKELSSYSLAIQQMVSIARAVDVSSKVLVLDEPTSSLDSNEVEELYRIMRRLRKEGMAIVFITHFIDQVYAITDRITVLRNGKYIGTYETKEISHLDLIGKMIGKEYKPNSGNLKEERADEREECISIKNLSKKGKINPFSFQVKKGEIFGLAGLLGSGRSEIAQLLFGVEKNDTGTISIDNEMVKRMYPQKAIEKGMAFCPEDRKTEGIIGELSIRENIIMALQTRKGMFKFISRKEQNEIAEKYVKLLGIKTPSIEQRIDKLSGGNQQKVILARWLVTQPKFLILDEPTRGIDIGSRTEIQNLILKLADEGMTILFISSELEEMVKCCNRVIVLRDRRVIGELEGGEISEDKIMKIIADGGVI